MNNIALLLSGGVDSSVALHMLCSAGMKPDCYYIHIGPNEDDSYSCTSDEDVEMCKAVTSRYGVNFDIIDLHNEYWDEVVKYTMRKVYCGYTPNPDVMCNNLIKFGAFYKKIGYKYDYIATGHYATRIGYTNLHNTNETIIEFRNLDGVGRLSDDVMNYVEWWIAPAVDPVKDQVDFIANIDTSIVPVSKILFPIGHLMKDEVRKIAEENHLINAKRKDSQGICFLGKINYNDYIKKYLGEQEGDIIDADSGRKIGTHKGHWFHTIGQRKGLGLSGGPWFVVGKNNVRNQVFVSTHQDRAMIQEFYVMDVNWLTKNMLDEYLKREKHNEMQSICRVKFKIRHSPEIYEGNMVFYGSDKDVKIISDTPITVASGQYCTLYDDMYDVCYGSGEILSRGVHME